MSQGRLFRWVLLISLLVLLAKPTTEVLGQCFVRGDSNGDGLVNVADPLFLLGYLFCGGATPPCLEAGNVNDLIPPATPQQLSIADTTDLLKFLFNCGPALDATTSCGNGCGTDATLPSIGCSISPGCPPPLVAPLDPTSTLTFVPSPPSPATGLLGRGFCKDVTVQLTAGPAVAAWSTSIQVSGCSILSATSPQAGSLSQVTGCGTGTTSASIFSTCLQGNALPAGSTTAVLNLKVAGRFGIPCALSFVDGQQCCSEPPVPNVIAWVAGGGFKPMLPGPLAITEPAGASVVNTPAGTNILVCLSPNVWVTFDQVTTAGTTTVSTSCVGTNFIGLPFGAIGCRRIVTTAVYPQVNPLNVTVCIRYNCAYNGPLTLFHNNPPWQLVPITNDPCAKVICGRVNHLSDFALVLPSELVPFRRGDANGDGAVDLSDAVALLGCQFLGTVCPNCADAADANDDKHINIADAIYLLNWKFLGNAPPPSPGPFDCGTDPTADGLVDCSYPEFSHPAASCFTEEEEA